MRHTGLRTRVKRLEKRLGRRKPLPTIVTGIYAEEMPGEVIGLEGLGVAVMRAVGEPLGQLQARAATLTGARILKTLYAAPAVKIEPVPAPAPVPSAVPVDPWALAGIGRQATRQELIEMGALAVPPERLI